MMKHTAKPTSKLNAECSSELASRKHPPEISANGTLSGWIYVLPSSIQSKKFLKLTKGMKS